MKNLLQLACAFLIIAASFTACQEEELDTTIYTPQGVAVSSSIEALTQTIATRTQLNAEDISVEILSFLEVSQGYIAEIAIYVPATNEHYKVYHMSQDNADRLQHQGDLNVATQAVSRSLGSRSNTLVASVTAYCSCGLNSFPSSGCTVSVTTHPDGSITGTCQVGSCGFGCVFHS
ncbi:MAG: hypothetical protein AAGD05_03045 [Bacteroidota bacterium]